MRNTGAAGRVSHWREIPHAQRAPAAVPDEQHGENVEASSAHARRGGGASMRLRVGFTMDPTAERGPDRVPPRSGCRRTAVRRPPLPRTGNPPCAPNAFAAPAEAWEAERAMGDRRSDGRQGGRLRPSGCDRARLRALARMRGTRHARYLQTLPQPYSYAAYLTQPYSYAEYACAAYLLQLYPYADIT